MNADDGVGQLFDMVQLKGVAVGVEKTAPVHRAVIGQFALAAVMNAAQAVFALDPQRRQVAIARQVRMADVFSQKVNTTCRWRSLADSSPGK